MSPSCWQESGWAVLVAGGSGLCLPHLGSGAALRVPAGFTLALGALIAKSNSQVLPQSEKKMDVGVLLVSDNEIVVL